MLPIILPSHLLQEFDEKIFFKSYAQTEAWELKPDGSDLCRQVHVVPAKRKFFQKLFIFQLVNVMNKGDSRNLNYLHHLEFKFPANWHLILCAARGEMIHSCEDNHE